MATQGKRAAGTSGEADGSAVLQGAATSIAEFSQQQMAAGAEALSAMFRAAQALQQVQVQMGQRAALLHSQAAENLRKATSPMELASIQSTLLVYEFQEAVRYWQELSTAVAKAGGEVLRPAPGQAEAPGTTSPAAAVMGAAMNAAAPMADAFQQMFTAPMKAAQQAAATH